MTKESFTHFDFFFISAERHQFSAQTIWLDLKQLSFGPFYHMRGNFC